MQDSSTLLQALTRLLDYLDTIASSACRFADDMKYEDESLGMMDGANQLIVTLHWDGASPSAS